MPPARSGSKHHRIEVLGWGTYRLSWQVEVKYTGSRLLFHRTMTRDTDKKGAERFAKKWKLAMSEVLSTPTTPASGSRSSVRSTAVKKTTR